MILVYECDVGLKRVVRVQAQDAPYLVRMLDQTLGWLTASDEVVGEKGFEGDRLRWDCLDRGLNPNIPLKAKPRPGGNRMGSDRLPGAQPCGAAVRKS